MNNLIPNVLDETRNAINPKESFLKADTVFAQKTDIFFLETPEPMMLYPILDMAKACCEMSRRDGAIVAWHEVPGTAPPQESRPVGYGVIRAGVRADSRRFRKRSITSSSSSNLIGHKPAPDHTVPYGTVLSRDAFPGTSCQATIGVVPTGRAGRHSQQHLASLASRFQQHGTRSNSNTPVTFLMTVNSIDPLAPYKVSDDLVLELASVTAVAALKRDPRAQTHYDRPSLQRAYRTIQGVRDLSRYDPKSPSREGFSESLVSFD
jgi:hypothetical protein